MGQDRRAPACVRDCRRGVCQQRRHRRARMVRWLSVFGVRHHLQDYTSKSVEPIRGYFIIDDSRRGG